MIPISEAIDSLFMRGSLPARIEMTSAFGPFRPGDVLEWSDLDRCYMDKAKRWCLWACNARQMFGSTVVAAKPVHTQQQLFAA
jgi:hypothetical protein